MTKPIALAGLAVAAVVAAGVGSYLGARHATGPAPETASIAAADPALAVAEPPAAPETQPEPATVATETVVDVEPAAANPARAPRPAPASAARPVYPQPSPRPQPAPAATRSTARDRTPAAARPVDPSPRTRPAPAPVTTPPEPAPEPVSATAPTRAAGDRARAATTDPPRPAADLPVVEGWTRAGGPAGGASPRRTDAAAPRRTEAPARPPLASTSPFDTRGANSGIAPSPWPSFDELEIAADSVIGIQIETAVSTRTARLEDTVEAQVTRDVQVGARVAISSGTRMRGSVVLVEPGGRLRSASRLGVRFHTLVMDDGAEVALSTETIYREGKAPGGDSVAKIGGAAVAGSILGAIFGGERGAAIGGSIGAAGGTAAAPERRSRAGQPAAGLAADGAIVPPGVRHRAALARPRDLAVALAVSLARNSCGTGAWRDRTVALVVSLARNYRGDQQRRRPRS